MKKQLLKMMAVTTAVVCGCLAQASAQTWNQTGDAVASGTTKLGTTNAFPLNLTTNNVSRLVIDATGKVGLSTAPGLSLLTMKGAGSTPAASWISSGAPLFAGFGETTPGNADFNLMMASTAANARGVMGMKRARGTLAAPAAVALNDQLGSLLVSGFDGTNFQGAAAVDFFADGTPSAGSVPARISFVTGSSGATRVERLKIASGGDVTVTTGNLGLTAGNLNMNSAAKTIQFATPTVGGNGMMTMFPSGTQNPDRMILSHSAAYPNWGIQYQDTLDAVNFLSGGTPVLTAQLGYQRVGVMTSTPGARFDIAGTGAYDLTGAANYADFRLGDANYNLKMGVANAGGGAGDAYVASSNRLYLGTGNTFTRSQTLAINPDGTVGIGGYLANAKLGVIGDTISTQPVISATGTYTGGNSDVRGVSSTSIIAPGYGYGVYGTGGYMGGYFSAAGSTYTGTDYGVYGVASGSTAGTRIGVYGTASGALTTEANWGGYFPTKTYTNELRVGGTKGATGYVAAINGKLIATEVRVEVLASWPDYVFSANHKLLPLEDLEASINANKHLPGIPSAAEVKEGGIMLGEMQTKTMEKVEENTLYIIELNKKIKMLEDKIEQLTKAVK